MVGKSLLNRVGCEVTWVTWVRGLRESNFNVGCVGYVDRNIFYVGQNFMWVIIFTWVVWVKYIFALVQNFCGSNFFCVGQLLFTRRDYFTILQLKV